MMYIINKNSQITTGEHVIHKISCLMKPQDKNAIELGDFAYDKAALVEAHRYYACVNGCKYCCKDIHLKR